MRARSKHALSRWSRQPIPDATIAAWGSKYAYNRPHPSSLDPAVAPVVAVPQSPSYPSEHAVAAGAAAAVLSYFISGSGIQALRHSLMAGVAFPSDVLSGLHLGESVSRAVVAYAQQDGSNQQLTGSYPRMPGVWSSSNPLAPLAGSWKPWVLTAPSDFRLGPPPAFGSDAANAQYAMDKDLNRTNATNHLAWFWQPGFFQPWLQQVDLEMFQNHLDSNPPRAARAYAYETVAQHDAALACSDSKYTYLELRPSQADPTITTLFANPHIPAILRGTRAPPRVGGNHVIPIPCGFAAVLADGNPFGNVNVRCGNSYAVRRKSGFGAGNQRRAKSGLAHANRRSELATLR